MKTLTIINQKGGVGKSTTAAALGAGLIRAGGRVLFIDLDPQGNLTYSLGADAAGMAGATALDVLMKAADIKAAAIGASGAELVPSSPALAGADMTLTATGKEYRLKEQLKPIAGDYDYCIIDTPPALGILTINALTAADAAIIPAQADIFSLQGIAQLYSTIDAVTQYTNPGLTVAGILLTRWSGRAIISRDITELLDDTAAKLHTRLFTAKIRECIAIKEAQAQRVNIFDYAPKSNATADYSEFVKELRERGII